MTRGGPPLGPDRAPAREGGAPSYTGNVNRVPLLARGQADQALLTPPASESTMRRILSSPSWTVPRPSRLDVVTQSDPSGAMTAARSRPYRPTRAAVGAPSTLPVPVSRTIQSRVPRRQAAPNTLPAIAAPEQDA